MPDETPSLFPDAPEGVRPEAGPSPDAPLAERRRPRGWDDFAGQEELVGPGGILREMVEGGRLSSMVFWGPPGSGKTTLARLIAARTQAVFLDTSAVTSGVKEMKEAMTRARDLLLRTGRRTILFVDEVHRFNKAQQDAFLPYVERGDILFIGATTENPSFEVNSALLSRSKVFIFQPLSEADLRKVVVRALEEDPKLRVLNLRVEEGAIADLVAAADGDARRALTALELASVLARPADGEKAGAGGVIGRKEVEKALQKKALMYDRAGEEHYNIISALHKSLRGSDPDAALYWLARMLEAGEDRRYVLRRMIRFASEDVGCADSRALLLAVSALQSFDLLGIPEGDLALAQLTVYLALAPKSNAVYVAWGRALRDVREEPARPVPLHIRNAPTRLMKEAGYGKGYEYSHDFAEAVSGQSFFPEGMGERRYFRPTLRGEEKSLGERLQALREAVRKARERKGEKKG